MRAFLFTLLLLLAPADDPTDAGRRGNSLYERGQYAQAAEAFRAGLAATPADDLATRYGLLHNLGAALHRLEDYDGAQEAFNTALSLAAGAGDVARAAYNAGNTAFRRDDLQAAVDRYKQALLADPDDENARFNYEVAKRQLDEEQQQDQQQQQGGDEGEQNPEDEQQEGDEQQQGEQDPQDPQQGDEEEDQQQGEGDQQEEQQQDPQEPGEEEQPQQQPPPDPNELSRQQAEQILDALENEEEQLLRQVQQMKGRPRQVEKDW